VKEANKATDTEVNNRVPRFRCSLNNVTGQVGHDYCPESFGGVNEFGGKRPKSWGVQAQRLDKSVKGARLRAPFHHHGVVASQVGPDDTGAVSAQTNIVGFFNRPNYSLNPVENFCR
jgi:hypothetical protein